MDDETPESKTAKAPPRPRKRAARPAAPKPPAKRAASKPPARKKAAAKRPARPKPVAASASPEPSKAAGPLQGGVAKVRARVRGLAADPSAAARDAYATGRDYARRGAETVTRVAADNTALTTLVAGAAVAVVGWLVLGRKGRKE